MSTRQVELFFTLPKFEFLPWDLFKNWSEVVIILAPNADEFENGYHGRNSNFVKTRKKGSTHLVAIHGYN